jgi:hypothetical protein
MPTIYLERDRMGKKVATTPDIATW